MINKGTCVDQASNELSYRDKRHLRQICRKCLFSFPCSKDFEAY